MAGNEQAKDQRDYNEEVNKTAEAYQKLKKAQEELLFLSRDYADEAKKAAKEVLGSSIAASETAKAFRNVASAAKDITDNYAEVLTGEKTFQGLIKERQKLDKAQKSFNTDFEQFLSTVVTDQTTINQIMSGQVDSVDAIAAAGGDLNGAQFDLLELYELQNAVLAEEAENMDEIARRAENIDEAMRPLGKHAISLQDMGDGLSKGLSKAGLGGLSDKLGMDDAIKGARETAASLTEGGTKALGMGDKLGIAGDMATSMGKNLMKSLGPAALIAMAIEQIVNAFKMIDGASGEVAKSMGVSAKEGRALVESSNDIAMMSGDLLISTKDIVASQMSLNKLFGSSVTFSNELALEFAEVQEKTGLSAEAMNVFAKNALQGKGTIKEQLISITAITQEMSAQSGVMLNAKDIQEGIANLSATQRLNAGSTVEEMTKQVFQQKLLGLSSSQLASSKNGLLDFETSIGAEMEAELLTGKQLNLEGARAAALANDNVALAAEIAKNVGTEAEFRGMNAIQQEALSKAFNMSIDDMSVMLMEQEKLEALKASGALSQSAAQEKYNKALKDGTLTEELKAELAEAGFLAQLESATAADNMAAAMEKIQDLFASILLPLMPIVDALIAILNPIFALLSPILKLIGDIVGLVMKFLMPGLDALQRAFADIGTGFTEYFGGIQQVIEGIINMDFTMVIEGLKTMGGAIIGLILIPIQFVLDSIIGSFNSIIRLANKIPKVNFDLIESPDLGEMAKEYVGLAEGGIVTKPINAIIGEGSESEAVIPLSKLDAMLGQDKTNQSSGNGNKNIEMLLTKLLIAVEKGGDVYMDGNKVGRSLALATSNMG